MEEVVTEGVNTTRIKRYLELSADRDGVRKKDKDLTKEINELEEQIIANMSEAETSSIRVEGTTVFLKTSTYAGPKADKTEALISVLKVMCPEIVKETVNRQTLSSFIAELTEDDQELPDELASLVHVFKKFTIGTRKATAVEKKKTKK